VLTRCHHESAVPSCICGSRRGANAFWMCVWFDGNHVEGAYSGSQRWKVAGRYPRLIGFHLFGQGGFAVYSFSEPQ
jgi:hypothetical protein